MGSFKGYTHTVPTGGMEGTPRLVLEQPTGDVNVEGWDRPEIEISISDERELFHVEISGNSVQVRSLPAEAKAKEFVETLRNELGNLGELGHLGAGLERAAARVERTIEKRMRKFEHGMKGINIDFGRWTGGRDYTIRVPHNCDLSLRSSSGDLMVVKVTGTQFIQSTSGDITLDNVEGAILANTSSGDLSLTSIKGKLGGRSISGDVTVREGHLHEVSVASTSGDLNLDLRVTPEREFELRSVSGDIDLKLPHDARLSIQVNTLSGSIRSGFGGTDIPRKGHGPGRSGTIEVNGGGIGGRIHTVSGDITLRPIGGERRWERGDVGSGTVDLSRETPNMADIEGDARKEAELGILHSLQQGEITVDEAMRRLGDL